MSLKSRRLFVRFPALVATGCAIAAATLAGAGTAPVITHLSLVDADTDAPILTFAPIPDHAIINLATLPTRNLNILATTSPATAGSVLFGFQGNTNFRVENGAPYALFGDSGGDYLPWTPTAGDFAIDATAFSAANATGDAGLTRHLDFTIVDYQFNVDAGPDLRFDSAPAVVTLSAMMDPPDADIVSLTWTQLAGPPLAIHLDPAIPAMLPNLLDGDYTFRIDAVDSLGSTASDDVRVTIGTPAYPWHITGERRQWHRVTITFDGPFATEAGSPNPFSDYRLIVRFSHGDETYDVPGFFAADGDAASTGALEGNKWRVHFAPPATGSWTFVASFRNGPDVAVEDAPTAGTPTAFDGASGAFFIEPSDKSGRDHRGKGLLKYVDEHYLRFAQSGEYFLKGGADSPENFLAFADFDGTVASHTYAPHLADWSDGDPEWRGDRGRAIIGALNYLAAKGMNSVYFLTMNVAGDGNDVWPWISPTRRRRYDCSRLDQWEIVFSHMDRVGIALHVVTQETENDHLLDGGDLGMERRLYFRELIARFAHHLAIVWNLGEENSNTDAQRAEFIDYFSDHDPYHHPIVIHTAPGAKEAVYAPLLGNAGFNGPSLQIANNFVVSEWVDRSAAAARPWVVCYDEQAPATIGALPDAVDMNHNTIRKEVLWGTLMAGGAGVEYYFGYDYPNNDLNCEDWRSRDRLWDQTRIALDFFQEHLLFRRMRHANALVSAAGAYCFAEVGERYAVYLPDGQTTNLNLEAFPFEFTVRWFNPRVGGPMQPGDTPRIDGPGQASIGQPPANSPGDWLALVERSIAACDADINHDGHTDGRDIPSFVDCLAGGTSADSCTNADLNADGQINIDDVNAMIVAILCDL